MEILVILLYAFEDCDCVLNCRLGNCYRLETSFKCRVLFDILSVLLESRCADDLYLAS